MDKKRVLLVAQEMDPYLELTEMAALVKKIALFTQEGGMEVRVLMPRFGVINERRNRLHEVVRLSGINIIIDDDDYPLIIKVASLPGARIQVYFLDNEDFYKRKQVFHEDNGTFFEDNPERIVFFCKGVLETVKKFGWSPDIIHCHGWMTSLIPMFMKTTYAKDPVFNNAKIVFSLYDKSFEEKLDNNFSQKASISKEITEKELALFSTLDFEGFNLGATKYADGIIKGSAHIPMEDKCKEIADGKPWLEHQQDEDIATSYVEFYKNLLK